MTVPCSKNTKLDRSLLCSTEGTPQVCWTFARFAEWTSTPTMDAALLCEKRTFLQTAKAYSSHLSEMHRQPNSLPEDADGYCAHSRFAMRATRRSYIINRKEQRRIFRHKKREHVIYRDRNDVRDYGVSISPTTSNLNSINRRRCGYSNKTRSESEQCALTTIKQPELGFCSINDRDEFIETISGKRGMLCLISWNFI